jgi:hypothetical protein
MKTCSNSRRGIWVVVALCLGLLVPTVAQAQANSNPGILPPNSHPHGMSYGQWSAAWWQWALGIPTGQHPILDPTGAFCHVGQPFSHVLFLAGSFGGTVTRSCTVPAGTALFFPVANVACWRPGDAETEAGLRACAQGILDAFTTVSAQVDGNPIQSLQSYRVQSPLFLFPPIPADNPFGLDPAVQYDGVSDGYWLFLAPLPPGEHVIRFTASAPDFGFALDVTYNLTIAPGRGEKSRPMRGQLRGGAAGAGHQYHDNTGGASLWPPLNCPRDRKR